MSTLRTKIIRLAHAEPEMRRHLVPLLRQGMEHATEKAKKKYLKEHPDADPSNHTVNKGDKADGAGGDDSGSGDWMAKAKAKFKNVRSDIAKSIASGGEKLQQFVADKDYRNATLKKGATGVIKSPLTVTKKLLQSAKVEAGSMVGAGKAVVKAAKGGKLSAKEKHDIYGTSVYVAGAILAAVTGGSGLVVAGAVAQSFGLHVGIKAAHVLFDEGFLAWEAGDTVLGFLSTIAAEKGEKGGKEMSEEEAQEVLIHKLTALVLKELKKGVSDEDMAKILAGVEMPS